MKLSAHNKAIVNNARGFSLVEILVALTLLGLAGSFVALKIFDSLYEGQVNAAKTQMKGYENALKEFKRKCYFYPTTEQGLEALIEKPTSGRECKNYPPNGFIEDLQEDPWGGDFVYESDGKTISIYSYGQDGEQGGEEKDADVYLKERKKSDEDA